MEISKAQRSANALMRKNIKGQLAELWSTYITECKKLTEAKRKLYNDYISEVSERKAKLDEALFK